MLAKLGFHESQDVLKQLMQVDGLFVRRAAGTEQRVNKPGQSVSFADDDVGIFLQLCAIKLAFQELRSTAQPSEGVFDFMRQLANHLPASTVLTEQCVLAADPVSSRHVGHFDQQGMRPIGALHHGHAAINEAFMSVNLCWCQPHFIGIRYTRRQHSGEDVLKIIIIANYLQQRLAPGAVLADTKEIFCCGI